MMKRLDLHGVKHEDARSEVIRFVEDILPNIPYEPQGYEVEIVTGRSPRMRKIVAKVLEEYDLRYEVGGPLILDDSFIRVHIDY